MLRRYAILLFVIAFSINTGKSTDNLASVRVSSLSLNSKLPFHCGIHKSLAEILVINESNVNALSDSHNLSYYIQENLNEESQSEKFIKVRKLTSAFCTVKTFELFHNINDACPSQESYYTISTWINKTNLPRFSILFQVFRL